MQVPGRIERGDLANLPGVIIQGEFAAAKGKSPEQRRMSESDVQVCIVIGNFRKLKESRLNNLSCE